MSGLHLWHDDRASDGDVMSETLGVQEEWRLKCNGHILLMVDNQLDKLFRDQGSAVGKDKLISQAASHEFRGSSSRVTIGLIAVAKLLSPSHSQESVSHHKTFMQFIEKKALEGDMDSNLSVQRGLT